jgi:hypothetical protein
MKLANYFGIFIFLCCFFHTANIFAEDFKSLFADGFTKQKHPAGSLYYGTVKDSQQELVIRKRSVINNFRSKFKKTPVGTSSLDKLSLQKNIEAYCSHLVSGKDLNADPEGCTHDGSNALDKCDLGGVITQTDVARVKRLLDVSQGDKKSECITLVGKLANDSLAVDGAILQATIESVTDVAEDASLDVSPNSPNCTQNKKGKIVGCDEFKDTPMEGGLSNDLMSRFIVGFDGFGGFFKKLFLIRSTTNECEACFSEKYKTLQQASGLASDDFEKKYKEKLADAKLNFRVRKAEKALSEYVKFQERNQFMSRYLNGRIETCEHISGLSQLKPGCDPAQAKLVLDKIAERHKIKPFNNDLSFFINTLSKSHMRKLEEPVSVPECGASMKVTYNSYMAAYQTQVSTNEMQPSKLFTSETKDKLRKCLEYDQQCMLDIMADAFAKKYEISASVARRKVRSFFRQPFYRTLLTHRDSLLDYADSGDVTVSNDLATYKEKNKDRLAEIANRDSDVACKAFGNDFMLALCVSDEGITKEYSGQGVKEELADMLASADSLNEPGGAGKSLVNLTVACNMLNKAGNFNTEIHESNSVSDKSFDRLELADSFLRSNINHSSRLSRKQNSFIENYAKKLCADAVKEKMRENEREQANKGMFAKSSSPWDFSSLSCAGSKVMNNRGECVPRYLASVGSLDFSRAEPPSSNIGDVSTSKSTKAIKNTIFELDEYDSFRYDQEFTSSGSYQTGFMTNEPIPKAIVVNEETIQETEQEGGFLESVSQMAENLNKTTAAQNINPTSQWPTPLYDAPKTIRAPASEAEEDGFQSERKRISSERSILDEEDRQLKAEQQAFSQLQQTQAIQDLKSQTQIEQIRLDLQKLQSSNKELMASIKKISARRKSQAEENVFDQNVDQDVGQVEEQVEDREVANTKSVNRGLAQTTRTRFDASSPIDRLPKNSPSASAPQTNLPKQSAGDRSPVTSGASSGANFGVQRGGSQAVSSRVNSNSSSVSFVPSLGLQKTIASDSSQEIIPQEKKIELLKEFLSYVEKNPEYREGRYLSSENDKITIDYKGKTVTLSVTDIQDSKARVDLQERLLRQRMVINQYVRTTRLENLKRLLASTRDQP